MSELIFWNGSLLQLINPTDHFAVRLILYPQRIFLQAAIPLDHTYFRYMKEFPLYDHSQNRNVKAEGIVIDSKGISRAFSELNPTLLRDCMQKLILSMKNESTSRVYASMRLAVCFTWP